MISCTRFESDQYDKVPFFMFGDYNFRLDTNQLVKVCTRLLFVCSGSLLVIDYLIHVASTHLSVSDIYVCMYLGLSHLLDDSCL